MPQSSSPQQTEVASPNPENQEGITRRAAAGRVLAFLLAPNLLSLSRAEASEGGTPQSATNDKSHGEDTEHAAAHDLPAWLDYGTMGLVIANFARHLGWEAMKKGKELGPKSATEMNVLAGARIAALELFGGQEGKHVAHEDLHEIIHGLTPVPVLVLLSDMTSKYLKVNEKRFFELAQDTLEAEGDYREIKRPPADAPAEEWENHLQRVEQDIVRKAAQIAGLSSALAPIATTYASSAITDAMKEVMTHMVYEQSYTQEAVKERRRGRTINQDALREKAIERTDKLINGTFGYSKLMMTLSANTQGSWGIGDPPEIYFAMNHPDPKSLALGHGIGAVNAHVYTVGLNAIWLKKAGLLSTDSFSQYVKAETDTIRKITAAVINPHERMVSFQQGGKLVDPDNFLAGVSKQLAEQEDLPEALANVLQQIPEASLRFSPREYVQSKLRFLQRGVDQIPLAELVDSEGVLAEGQFDEVFKAFMSGDTGATAAALKKIERSFETLRANELADYFDALVEDAGKYARRSAPVTGESDSDPELTEQHQVLVDGVQALIDETKQTDNISAALRYLSDAPDGEIDREQLSSIIGAVDVGALQQALVRYTDLHPKNEPTDNPEGEDGHHGDGHGDGHGGAASRIDKALDAIELGHSPREVLFALLTQIPTVPSLARASKLMIPRAIGVNGEEPTTEQLKQLCTIVIPVESVMSGTADNVAAYLFAENVIQHFFERTFGEDVFEKAPGLKGKIGVVTKLIAEQGGSLSKIGNGPNFTQDELQIHVSDHGTQGISIERASPAFGNSLPNKNAYATIANGTLVAASVAYLWKLIDSTKAQLEQS